MDFFDVVNNRYSYRGSFEKKIVSKEEITKIMECAIKAPSGCNFQTTSFVVVSNEETKEKISEIMPTEGTKTASFIIVVLTESVMTKCDCDFELEDYAAAVENTLLAVSAMGMASVWLDGVLKFDNRASKIHALLDIPSNQTVRAILPVGYATETTQRKEKKPLEERVKFVD